LASAIAAAADNQKELVLEIQRDAVNLNGPWQCLRDQEDAPVWQAATADKLPGWQPTEVPGPLLQELTSKEQEGIRCVWAKREFALDRSHTARLAVLKWNGIRFGATVWINGRKVAAHPAVGPATYLLPPHLLQEGANRIVVQAPGWAGVRKSKSGYPLIPTGASTQSWGSKIAAIFDDMWIEFYDRAYMKWLLAMPSLKEQQVVVRTWFDSAVELPEEIELRATLSHPKEAGMAPTIVKRSAVKVRQDGQPVDFTIPIKDPLYWTPQTPHLYTVKIAALAAGQPCDTAEFRFGMREIAVKDGHYRLNGQPFWLRGSNMVNEWHWAKSYTENVKRYLVDEARLMNLGCFRTHTQPPVARWCNVADEHGMMFLAEMPVLFNFADFRFTEEEWKVWHANALLDATGWITKLWNHPSVVTWVLSNESTRNDDWEAGEYYQHVVSLDPTRPPMRSAGRKGTAETVDIHTCGNIARGPEGWAIQACRAEAGRKDPQRTLGNSEYMNFGVEVYSLRWFGQEGLGEESRLFYAQLCLEHTEAMRRLQFDLILPYMYAGWTSFNRGPGMRTWHDPYPTPMAASLHSCMAPVLASLDLFDANYKAGSEMSTPLWLINETQTDVAATIDIYVTPHNPLFLPDAKALSAAVSRQSLHRSLKANAIAPEHVHWKVPEQPGTYYLAAVLTQQGQRPVVSQREIRALADPVPDQRLKRQKFVVLGADPAGLKWLESHGANVATSVGPGPLDALAVVVWDAERAAADRPAAPAIVRYVENGGRLVILDHRHWNWMDLADLKIADMGSAPDAPTSRAFPCRGMENHPLLAGLPAEALRRWNGLPGTVASSYLAADLPSGRPVLWAENPKKIVAMSIPRGKGEVLVCLLQAKQRLEGEAYDPAAVQVLLNLLVPRAAQSGGPADQASARLERDFHTPPDSVRPWAYWWWLNANVTGDSITRDLEAMKSQGLGGLLLFDVTAYGQQHVPSPPRRVEFMSPPWRQLVRHAMSEANRLGLQMSMNLSTCGGALRAPWQTGVDAPKSLVWTSADVVGPKRASCVVPRRQGPQAWDVALMAARIVSKDDAAGPLSSPTETAEIRFSDDPKQWQPVVLNPKQMTPATEVVDLTDQVDARGRLTWDVPAGRWRLVRFLYTLMDGAESDVDMLDAAAVETHFNRLGRAILEDAGPLAGKTLTHFYSVSWEGAIPTWTVGFDRQFEKYRGYSLRGYLPVLAGMAVNSAEAPQRFLRDYGRTLSDCFLHNCYEKLGTLCRQAGLKWHSESGGPWRRDTLLFTQADALAFWGRNDMPQGEFWWPGTPAPGRSNGRQAAMAAHIYGKPLASIEAFTHMGPHWSAYPAALKPGADAAFCDGINQFVWHTFSASPPDFGKPGIVYFAGTHLNPNVTWWEQAGPFLSYLARCQTMLRQGQFVADVCCYRSDRNYTTWNRSDKASKSSFALPGGYAFDLLSTEVLVDRLSVEDGRLVLPGGMKYRLLLVDPEEESLPPEALRKIIQLAGDGATVVLGQRQPLRAAGLRDYPACDEEVRRLAADLWGSSGDRPFSRPLGKGKLIGNTQIDKVLSAEGILPDCMSPWEYIHRRSDEMDVYFLAGAGEAECTFRVAGKEPELWDPRTGATGDAVCYRTSDDGRTIVPLGLPEHGSIFVVFRKPAQERHLVSVSGPEAGLQIEGRSDSGARISLWRQGRHVLRTSQGEQVTVDAAMPDAVTLAGPWNVRFAPGWGAPESVIFEELIPWDKHPDDGIKYFSGTATYRKTFPLSAEQAGRLVRLQLGDVKYIARVRLNGKDLGVVWTSPWTADLSAAVRPGENELQIAVTNLWTNRLIGDAALPEDRRLTKTNIFLQAADRTVKTYQGYSSRDPLAPSGLLGPVRLEFGQRREVRF
jgi:hypothetical protein